MSASELEMVFLKENYEPIQVNKDGRSRLSCSQRVTGCIFTGRRPDSGRVMDSLLSIASRV